MPWNVPGGSGNKDPWGQGKRGEQGPPDLDEIVRKIQSKLGGLFGGGKGGNGGNGGKGAGAGGGKAGGIGFGLIIGIVLLVWLASGIYIVQQGERGVILRFGKKVDVTQAGPHWRLPFPIDSVEKVNVEKVSTVEVGYRTNPRTGGKSKVPREALMITEDENIIDIEFAVQYKIKNASDYLFNVHNPLATIMQATESAVREIAGQSTMDFILTEGREEVGQKTRILLQVILDGYQAGIDITELRMQAAVPPEQVKAAFDDAVKAREDEERFKNEAEAYANDIIPRARGQAARMLEEAEGYKASVIARAEGDARRFTLIAREYAKAPAVTRQRLYLETVEEVLSNTTKIYIDQKGGNNLIYLPLDKLMARAAERIDEAQVPETGAEAPSPQPLRERPRGRLPLRRRAP